MADHDNDDLLEKYNKGLCTEDEKAIIESWFLQWEEVCEGPSEEELDRAREEIMARLPGPPKPPLIRTIGIAAGILSFSILVVWFFIKPDKFEATAIRLNKQVKNINPGSNKATLTLSHGKTIILSDIKNGIIIEGSRLTYNDGSAVEQGNSGTKKNILVTNTFTIATPPGGTYKIVLPDSTKVWLNAASSLTYTTMPRERGIVRNAKLSGEAYFEVAPDKVHPFIVQTDKQTVEVLGTHFNVNSYEDEGTTKTTLLKGAIKITNLKSQKSQALLPYQQAVVSDSIIRINRIDPQESIAWKNGEFYFNNQSLETVMKQISRWYNVEIAFQNKDISKQKINGAISRFGQVSEILAMLELTGEVHFKIEGRRIVIMN